MICVFSKKIKNSFCENNLDTVCDNENQKNFYNIDHNDNLQMVPVLVLDLDRVKRLRERRLLSLSLSSPLSPSASRAKINCHSG